MRLMTLYPGSRSTRAAAPWGDKEASFSQALSSGYRFQNPIVIILRFYEKVSVPCNFERLDSSSLTEESIRQSDGVDALHGRIFHKIRVNEEEHRHINRLSSIQFLLFKAEALYLAEIWGDLTRSNTVCCNTDNVRRAFICRGIKSKCRLTGQHTDFTLLWCKFPRKDVWHWTIEGDSKTTSIGHWRHARWGVTVSGPVCEYWLTVPADLLTNLQGKIVQVYVWARTSKPPVRLPRTILYRGTEP